MGQESELYAGLAHLDLHVFVSDEQTCAHCHAHSIAATVIDNTPTSLPHAQCYWMRLETAEWEHRGQGLLSELLAQAHAPVVVVELAVANQEEIEQALRAGADDVFRSTLSERERRLRVLAVARRMHWRTRQQRMRVGPLVLDIGLQQLTIRTTTIALTAHETALLRVLMRSPNIALNREALVAMAWRNAHDVGPRAVDNVILRLRRKLPERGLLETVRKSGFRLRVH